MFPELVGMDWEDDGNIFLYCGIEAMTEYDPVNEYIKRNASSQVLFCMRWWCLWC